MSVDRVCNLKKRCTLLPSIPHLEYLAFGAVDSGPMLHMQRSSSRQAHIGSLEWCTAACFRLKVVAHGGACLADGLQGILSDGAHPIAEGEPYSKARTM